MADEKKQNKIVDGLKNVLECVEKIKSVYNEHEDTIRKGIDFVNSFIGSKDRDKGYTKGNETINYTNQQILDLIRESVSCGNFFAYGSSGKFIFMTYHFGLDYKLDVAIDKDSYRGYVNVKNRDNKALNDEQKKELLCNWNGSYSFLQKNTINIKEVSDARKKYQEIADAVNKYLSSR